MKKCFLLVVFAVLFLTSCSDDDDNQSSMMVSYNFDTDSEGWETDFADYPKVDESRYELDSKLSVLPEPLNKDDKALKLSGKNYSDDLFMYLKRKITGLDPNRRYNLTFNLKFATNAPSKTFGVGGSAGESVYIKAGASQIEPDKAVDSGGDYRMNIKKGNQDSEGTDMFNLGDFSNGSDKEVYTLKTLTNKDPFSVQADKNGELWVIIGTDSGFEGTTTIYYTSISLKFD